MADDSDSQPFPQSLCDRFVAAASGNDDNNNNGAEESVSFCPIQLFFVFLFNTEIFFVSYPFLLLMMMM